MLATTEHAELQNFLASHDLGPLSDIIEMIPELKTIALNAMYAFGSENTSGGFKSEIMSEHDEISAATYLSRLKEQLSLIDPGQE